jgi:hypothetical protein
LLGREKAVGRKHRLSLEGVLTVIIDDNGDWKVETLRFLHNQGLESLQPGVHLERLRALNTHLASQFVDSVNNPTLLLTGKLVKSGEMKFNISKEILFISMNEWPHA